MNHPQQASKQHSPPGVHSATPRLFSPITLRSVQARNRIMLSPLCEYSAQEGLPTTWHMVHLGSRAVGGAGIIFTEATAVEARGRISLYCTGIWNEAQQEAWAPIAAFISAQGAVPGMQLAHAGRKGAVCRPWEGQRALTIEEGAWQPIAPSPLSFNQEYPLPREMGAEELREVVEAFGAAAGRAFAAGFRILEVHAGHGYLLQSFLSPLSNHRKDDYGGTLKNRARLLMEVLDAVRAHWPEQLPLFVRISGKDWMEGGFDLPDAVALARLLKARGDVDLVDCSSGGNDAQQRISIEPGYQVHIAEAVRREAGIATAAVGLIRDAHQAEGILVSEQADLIAMGRLLMAQPYWPLQAAATLGFAHPWPPPYLRARI